MKCSPIEIGDITDVVTKGTTPTTYGKPFVDSGINFIKAEALNGDSSLEDSGFAFINQDTHDLLKRSILQKDDVLVTIAGANIGRCGFVKESHLPANTNQAVGIVRVSKDKALPRFIYYYFKQQSTYDHIQGLGGQAAQPNLNLANLKKIPVLLPSIKVQEKIASILSTYDDLIENNRRRMALLEDTARQLYQEWFVRLRFPGHEHSHIVDSVPEGWKRVTVPEIIDVNPKDRVESDKEIWYVSMSCLSETGMAVDSSGFEARTSHTSVKFRKDDVLLARITPCLENGKTAFVHFLEENDVACGSTEFIVLRGQRVSPFFTYCLARSYDFREHAIKSMVGSSGRQRVQTTCFEKFMLGLPSRPLLSQFDEAAKGCFEQIANLSKQNQKLRAARDLLLPKLMSGEIAV